MARNFEKQEKRIESIFPKRTDDISKRMETLKVYKQFLEENLDFPVKLTGIEDFNWEEFYIFGPGDKKESKAMYRTIDAWIDIDAKQNEKILWGGSFLKILYRGDHAFILEPISEDKTRFRQIERFIGPIVLFMMTGITRSRWSLVIP